MIEWITDWRFILALYLLIGAITIPSASDTDLWKEDEQFWREQGYKSIKMIRLFTFIAIIVFWLPFAIIFLSKIFTFKEEK